jgi:hypothetical protein
MRKRAATLWEGGTTQLCDQPCIQHSVPRRPASAGELRQQLLVNNPLPRPATARPRHMRRDAPARESKQDEHERSLHISAATPSDWRGKSARGIPSPKLGNEACTPDRDPKVKSTKYQGPVGDSLKSHWQLISLTEVHVFRTQDNHASRCRDGRYMRVTSSSVGLHQSILLQQYRIWDRCERD